jgi:hypothetical protein
MSTQTVRRKQVINAMPPELLRKIAVKIAIEESDEAIEKAFRPTTLGGILLRNKDRTAEGLMAIAPNNILELELLYREVKAVQRYGADYFKDEGANI